jgi:hypothetical protein
MRKHEEGCILAGRQRALGCRLVTFDQRLPAIAGGRDVVCIKVSA